METLYASVVMVTVLQFQEENKTNDLTFWQQHGIFIQMAIKKTLYASVVMVTVLQFQFNNKTNNLTLSQ